MQRERRAAGRRRGALRRKTIVGAPAICTPAWAIGLKKSRRGARLAAELPDKSMCESALALRRAHWVGPSRFRFSSPPDSPPSPPSVPAESPRAGRGTDGEGARGAETRIPQLNGRQ